MHSNNFLGPPSRHRSRNPAHRPHHRYPSLRRARNPGSIAGDSRICQRPKKHRTPDIRQGSVEKPVSNPRTFRIQPSMKQISVYPCRAITRKSAMLPPLVSPQSALSAVALAKVELCTPNSALLICLLLFLLALTARAQNNPCIASTNTSYSQAEYEWSTNITIGSCPGNGDAITGYFDITAPYGLTTIVYADCSVSNYIFVGILPSNLCWNIETSSGFPIAFGEMHTNAIYSLGEDTNFPPNEMYFSLNITNILPCGTNFLHILTCETRFNAPSYLQTNFTTNFVVVNFDLLDPTNDADWNHLVSSQQYVRLYSVPCT